MRTLLASLILLASSFTALGQTASAPPSGMPVKVAADPLGELYLAQIACVYAYVESQDKGLVSAFESLTIAIVSLEGLDLSDPKNAAAKAAAKTVAGQFVLSMIGGPLVDEAAFKFAYSTGQKSAGPLGSSNSYAWYAAWFAFAAYLDLE